MKPITIKYRAGKQKVASLKADGVTGEIPAHNDTFYWNFTLEGKPTGRVAKSRLLPGYDKKADALYGRPWLRKIREAEEIVLTPYRDVEDRIGGLPKDYETVWEVNDDPNTWVIECPGKSILHITNNDEIVAKGYSFKECVKRLFQGQKVTLYYPQTTWIKKTL